MENEEKIEVNLRQYKGHFRKFPWALIIRILVILASLAVIFFLMKMVSEIKEEQENSRNDHEIEIEF